jgi:hypothetical protein
VSADGFHFVYQPLSGDGTIVARVVSTGYESLLHGRLCGNDLRLLPRDNRKRQQLRGRRRRNAAVLGESELDDVP